MKMFLHPERRREISDFMTRHLWVAEYKLNADLWVMSKEPHAYSDGPFEVMAMAPTLEEAFDKALRNAIHCTKEIGG